MSGNSIAGMYAGFGLTIASDIVLSELAPVDRSLTPDINIRWGQTPVELCGPLYSCATFDLAQDELLLRVPNVGRYHIRGGKEIVVEKFHSAMDNSIRLFLLGTALGVLIQQRGLLPIHGSTVVLEDGTGALFTGASGSGKSTMAAHLDRQGYTILNDDISVVTFDHDGRPIVQPGTNHLKLWADALDLLEHATSGLERVRDKFEKYFVPFDSKVQQPVSLRDIILLVRHRENNEMGLFPVATLEAIRVITNNTYRPRLIELAGKRQDHFKQCAVIAKTVNVFRFVRPRGKSLLNESIKILKDHWAGENGSV